MRVLFDTVARWADAAAEAAARRAAVNHGRRHMLARMGVALAGAGALPLLPFDRDRVLAQTRTPTETDCDYWRFCALSGNLCTCCGGSLTSCPAGSTPSVIGWIGTCENPADKKSYLISYNDCCGNKGGCGRCDCSNSVRDRPGYRIGVYAHAPWCTPGTAGYHCTVVPVVGIAE